MGRIQLWDWMAAVVAIVVMVGLVHGQPGPASASTSGEKAAPAPIPLADVATEAESVFATIRDIRADLPSERITATVTQQLATLTREIDGRLRESRKIVDQSPSIEMLRSLEGEWSRLRRELSALNRDLTDRINELERHVAQLDELGKTWDQTFAAAKDSNVPQEVLGRIEAVIAEIRKAHEAVEQQRARALTLQNRVGVQDSRIADALLSIGQTRENLLHRLFLQDSSPALFWTRRRTRELSAEQTGLSLMSPVFEMPACRRAHLVASRQPLDLSTSATSFMGHTRRPCPYSKCYYPTPPDQIQSLSHTVCANRVLFSRSTAFSDRRGAVFAAFFIIGRNARRHDIFSLARPLWEAPAPFNFRPGALPQNDQDRRLCGADDRLGGPHSESLWVCHFGQSAWQRPP
jgi:hypothetical protein